MDDSNTERVSLELPHFFKIKEASEFLIRGFVSSKEEVDEVVGIVQRFTRTKYIKWSCDKSKKIKHDRRLVWQECIEKDFLVPAIVNRRTIYICDKGLDNRKRQEGCVLPYKLCYCEGMQAPSPGGGPWRLGLGGVNLLYGLAGGRVSLRGVDLLSCFAVVDVRGDDPLAVSAALPSERGDGCEAGPAGRQRSARWSVPAGLTRYNAFKIPKSTPIRKAAQVLGELRTRLLNGEEDEGSDLFDISIPLMEAHNNHIVKAGGEPEEPPPKKRRRNMKKRKKKDPSTRKSHSMIPDIEKYEEFLCDFTDIAEDIITVGNDNDATPSSLKRLTSLQERFQKTVQELTDLSYLCQDVHLLSSQTKALEDILLTMRMASGLENNLPGQNRLEQSGLQENVLTQQSGNVRKPRQKPQRKRKATTGPAGSEVQESVLSQGTVCTTTSSVVSQGTVCDTSGSVFSPVTVCDNTTGEVFKIFVKEESTDSPETLPTLRPDADMEEFFRYENQREPPSLSNQGSLRSGKKSDILEHLNVPTDRSAEAKAATVLVLDMAAVVHMVRPTSAQTFNDYASQNLVSFLKSQVTPNVTRVDAVWDTYPEDNLKTQTHNRRGLGPRTRIGDGQTRIPKHDWSTGFLKNVDNKRELFPFLSAQLVNQDLGGRLLLSTSEESVLSNRQHDVTGLHPCNHTEADTRIILHLAHAAQQGHQVALVRTVDSDVVILAIHFFTTPGLSQLWICLGSGKKMRDIPIHAISTQLGQLRCLALPLFHAVTSCDTVSHFLGCGKKSAWSAWLSTSELTDTLITLTCNPQELSPQSQHMCTLERFVLVMYSKSCGLGRVNEARFRLFTSGKKTLEALPPTQAALYQHIRRAVLQNIFWTQATSVHQDIPDFHDWGWHKDSNAV
ncbi:hypothetical protein ACOMHN_067072 [Nucella lapillus]